jgi:hypothetical protein
VATGTPSESASAEAAILAHLVERQRGTGGVLVRDSRLSAPRQVTVGGGCDMLREHLKDWTDFDGAERAIAVCLGLMPDGWEFVESLDGESGPGWLEALRI